MDLFRLQLLGKAPARPDISELHPSWCVLLGQPTQPMGNMLFRAAPFGLGEKLCIGDFLSLHRTDGNAATFLKRQKFGAVAYRATRPFPVALFLTDEEMGRIIAAASEPFGTILAVTSVLGLRIGETLALRVSDIDFAKHVIRIRQTVDAATRSVQAVKSSASSADVPMPTQLEVRLRAHLKKHDGKSELLFVNRRGRPFSANKLREKQLHPLLVKLGIPRGGFHSMRHGAASALLADGATPAVVQRQLRHSDARITLGLYGHVVGDQQRNAVQTRSARLVN